jgi:hypothetical protein
MNLYQEIITRFPEAERYIGENYDLPYLVMGGIVDWLRDLPPEGITPEIRQRIVDFDELCCRAPRTNSAENDILTIRTVAFFEKLFRSPTTRALIPSLATRDDMIANAEYLKSWVDVADYEAALRLFD